MKFILAQPSIKRFKWELDVCLTNLFSLGVKPDDIILLFTDENISIVNHLKNKYSVTCYVHKDDRSDKFYIPAIKPYLWWQFLRENKDMEKETFFYMDSDVIFRELPDFKAIKYNEDLWVASNCNSYLNPSYIESKGSDLLDKMANIVQLNRRKILTLENRSGGAQWIITHPTAEYWYKVYTDCTKMYRMFSNEEPRYIKANGSNYQPIQKWTAEMWSQLWNVLFFEKDVAISTELNFSWATDDIAKWDKNKIYHNAGVTANMRGLFFKGRYFNKEPFNETFSNIDHTKCSWKYIEAIKKVK
jgi:hypothetical protein